MSSRASSTLPAVRCAKKHRHATSITSAASTNRCLSQHFCRPSRNPLLSFCLFLLLLAPCTFAASPCAVQIGSDIPVAISARLEGYLSPFSCLVLPPNATVGSLSSLSPNCNVLVLGNASLSATLISSAEAAALPPESYISTPLQAVHLAPLMKLISLSPTKFDLVQ